MAGELLKVTAGNASGQDIQLEQELVIGRSTPGAGSLGGDSEISRVHARGHRAAAGQPTYGGQQPAFAGGPSGGAPGRQGGSSKAPLIALAAVVLIALIVGGLAIGGVFSSDNKSKNTANTSTAIAPINTPATPPPTA